MGDIKILLVGCGYWGKNWYNTIKNSEYELVGIVDPKPLIEVDVPVFNNINSVILLHINTMKNGISLMSL